jgi:hypothetical protein
MRTTDPLPPSVHFHEEQRFRQLWLWLIVGFVAIMTGGTFVYGMVQQLVLGKPWGDKPMSDSFLLLVGTLEFLISLGLIALMFSLRLVTEVRDDGLYVRFVPFHFSFIHITPEELASREAITYSPLWDYGGWGIRYGRNGKAYNVSGNRGVQLTYRNGKKLLIGSQRPEELVQALQVVNAKGS